MLQEELVVISNSVLSLMKNGKEMSGSSRSSVHHIIYSFCIHLNENAITRSFECQTLTNFAVRSTRAAELAAGEEPRRFPITS